MLQPVVLCSYGAKSCALPTCNSLKWVPGALELKVLLMPDTVSPFHRPSHSPFPPSVVPPLKPPSCNRYTLSSSPPPSLPPQKFEELMAKYDKDNKGGLTYKASKVGRVVWREQGAQCEQLQGKGKWPVQA